MARKRTRSRSRQRGRGGGGPNILTLAVIIVLAAGGVAAVTVQSGAFSALQAERATDVDAVADENALVGVDTAAAISPGSGSGPACAISSNPLRVNDSYTDEVETNRDVLIEGDTVGVDIETSGAVSVTDVRYTGDVEFGDCLRADSATVETDLDSPGSTILRSGSTVTGDVDSSDAVVVGSDSAVEGDLDAGGEVLIGPSADVHGDIGADADSGTAGVTIGADSSVTGDIETDGALNLGSNSEVTGDIGAAGTLASADGSRIGGDIEAADDVTVRSQSVAGSIETDGAVTVGAETNLEGSVKAGANATIRGTIADDVGASGGVAVVDGGQINSDVDASDCVRVDTESSVSGDVDGLTVEGEARIDGDVSEENPDRSCGPIAESDATVNTDAVDRDIQQQRLLTLTNNFESELRIVVTLQADNAGTLIAQGSTGQRIAFTLAPTEEQSVLIEPDDPPDQIAFDISAESTEGGTAVTLSRSVPTETNSG